MLELCCRDLLWQLGCDTVVDLHCLSHRLGLVDDRGIPVDRML